MEQARYTFAVCIKCGVQSPPIIDIGNMEKQLKDMGWKTETLRFTHRAICPKCQHAQEA